MVDCSRVTLRVIRNAPIASNITEAVIVGCALGCAAARASQTPLRCASIAAGVYKWEQSPPAAATHSLKKTAPMKIAKTMKRTPNQFVLLIFLDPSSLGREISGFSILQVVYEFHKLFAV